MKRFGILLAASAALTTPAVLAAQDTPPPAPMVVGERIDGPAGSGAEGMDQAMAALGAMFKVEPLTAEQEARLPQAQRVINRMIPEGTLGEMMGGMFDKLLGPMLDATEAPADETIRKGVGIGPAALDLTEAQAAELAALFDPAYAERHKRERALMPALMRDMMTAMEPTMRKAMSELYAIHFSQKELDDVEAFFLTDSGAAYARKSFTMSSDPRIVSATMESLPQLMASFASMEEKMKAATADLPPKRSFAELSKAEKAKVSKLTGYTAADIEGMLAENADGAREE
ncbi:DUF2059 domain-containing protein [Erythrobacter colymbi]|uniref:DUF2059 domain-containing protein n=1 Tax=Erythrobacter colymbi TaxID=1161202 RepID=UPI000A39FFA0|nr:hypothetical protein [Erythrobacter colymbi]